jgi:hypothetical protein
MDASDDEHSNALTQEREFSSVIQDLRTNYTNDKMSEISTSFCFICLLHLANEQGLKIEVGGGNEGKLEALPEQGAEGADREEEGRREEVGNLEALKVWKVSRLKPIGAWTLKGFAADDSVKRASPLTGPESWQGRIGRVFGRDDIMTKNIVVVRGLEARGVTGCNLLDCELLFLLEIA